MKHIDLSAVEDAKEYKRLKPGGYVCKITSVEDVPAKEYLKMEYDIAEGEFKQYYQQLFSAKNFWGGSFIKSYKAGALKYFKAFITSVEESNTAFKWQEDETHLKNKLVGLVLGEEEYRKKDGTVSTRLYVDMARSVKAIREGNFTVPAKKCLPMPDISTTTFQELTDDDGDLPF